MENIQQQRIWYNHYRGYIVKSWFNPNTNLIEEEKIPYNKNVPIKSFLDKYLRK